MPSRGTLPTERISAADEVRALPRLINQPITPTLIMDATYNELRPASFTWRGSRFRVARALEQWAEVGRWWEKDVELTVWRVLLTDGGVMELAKARTQPPSWRLMAIHD